jgi:hypothetical protein
VASAGQYDPAGQVAQLAATPAPGFAASVLFTPLYLPAGQGAGAVAARVQNRPGRQSVH